MALVTGHLNNQNLQTHLDFNRYPNLFLLSGITEFLREKGSFSPPSVENTVLSPAERDTSVTHVAH